MARILHNSNQLKQVMNNPVIFIQRVSEIIQYALNNIVVQGISYKKMEESFEPTEKDWELLGDSSKLPINTEQEVKLEKTLWKQMLLDSTQEANFVKELQKREFAFITEIKSTNSLDELRSEEKYKINCAKQHFEALKDVEYNYGEPKTMIEKIRTK